MLEPDGKSFLTVGNDTKVRRWDLATGKPLGARELPHPYPGNGGLSPDGKTFVTMYGGGTGFFDTDTKKLRHLMLRNADAVASLFTFSRDSKSVAYLEHSTFPGPKFEVLVAEVQTGKRIGAIPLSKLLRHFAFAPDGKHVYVTVEGSLTCWDLDGKKIWSRDVEVCRVLIDPTGKTLLTFPMELQKPCRLWDAQTGKERGPLSLAIDSYWLAVAFTPDGKHAAFDTHRHVEVWDLDADKKVCRLARRRRRPSRLRAPTIERWSPREGCSRPTTLSPVRRCTRRCASGAIRARSSRMIWSPDSRYLASGSYQDPSLFVWDVPAGKRLSRTHEPNLGAFGPTSFAFAAGGEELVGAGPIHDLWVWDSATGKVKSHAPLMQDGRKALLYQAKLTPDGTKLFDLDPNTKTVSVREVPSGKVILTRKVPFAYVPVATTWDSVIALGEVSQPRDLLNGKAYPALQFPPDMIPYHMPSYSNDGLYVMSCIGPKLGDSLNGEAVAYVEPSIVAVWERATGRLVRTLDFKKKQIGTLALGANNRTLAIVLDDQVHLWDLAAAKMVRSIPTGRVHVLALSPDGRWAATSSDCTIMLWDLGDNKQGRAPLSAAEIDRLWHDLGDADAAHGVPARWRLSDAGDHTLPWIGKRLPPVPHVPKEEMAALLRNLDSDVFKIREPCAQTSASVGRAGRAALARGAAGECLGGG